MRKQNKKRLKKPMDWSKIKIGWQKIKNSWSKIRNGWQKVKGLEFNQKIQYSLMLGSLLIATSAFSFSLVSFNSTKSQNIANDQEQMDFTFSAIKFDDNLRLTSHFRIGAKYDVFISNNSKQTVSILICELFQIEDGALSTDIELLAGIYNVTGEKVAFPLNIEPGKSELLTFDINVQTTEEIKRKIFDEYGKPTSISYFELIRFLGWQGYDLLGNEIAYWEYDSRDVSHNLKIVSPHFPIYQIRVRTSRGKTYKFDFPQHLTYCGPQQLI